MLFNPKRRKTLAQPLGRLRVRRHAANDPRREHRAPRRFERHGKNRCLAAADGGNRILDVAPLSSCAVVASDAEHTHAVAAIRRGVHVQHPVIQIQCVAYVLIQRQRRRQLHDAIVLVAKS